MINEDALKAKIAVIIKDFSWGSYGLDWLDPAVGEIDCFDYADDLAGEIVQEVLLSAYARE